MSVAFAVTDSVNKGSVNNKSVNNSHALNLRNVSIRYGSQQVVHQVSLTIQAGDIGALVGPSGCGKSTLLRAVAGLEPVCAGEILVDQRQLSATGHIVAPDKRRVGMVFQDVALFPHLTVAQNIAFGLRHFTKQETEKRVDELLGLIELASYKNSYPNALSGGQQQRVALARALAPRPDVLLLDEPFSGLDASLKETLVPQVRALIKAENITALVVTHDQMEAFALADTVAIMSAGHIEQYDTPYNIYHQPQTRFVADFIGQGDFLAVTVLNERQVNTPLGVLDSNQPIRFAAESEVDLLLRPDDIQHDDSSEFLGVIRQKQFRGTHFQYQVELSNGQRLMCIASSHHDHQVGEKIGLTLEIDHLMLFER